MSDLGFFFFFFFFVSVPSPFFFLQDNGLGPLGLFRFLFSLLSSPSPRSAFSCLIVSWGERNKLDIGPELSPEEASERGIKTLEGPETEVLVRSGVYFRGVLLLYRRYNWFLIGPINSFSPQNMYIVHVVLTVIGATLQYNISILGSTYFHEHSKV